MAANPPGGGWGSPPPQQPWGQPPGPGGPGDPNNPYAPPMHGGAPQPAWGPQYAPQSASSSAQWAIGLAIASWVACSCFTAIPAIFMARSELAAIERGESAAAGKGLAQAAFWIALVNLVLTVLVVGASLIPILLLRL